MLGMCAGIWQAVSALPDAGRCPGYIKEMWCEQIGCMFSLPPFAVTP